MTSAAETGCLIDTYRHARLDFAEKLISIDELTIGLWIIVFRERSLGHPGYMLLKEVMPETCWGYCLLAIFVLRHLSLRRGSIWLRSLSSFWAAALWGFIAVSLFMSNGPVAGVAVYLVLSLKNVLVYAMRRGVRVAGAH